MPTPIGSKVVSENGRKASSNGSSPFASGSSVRRDSYGEMRSMNDTDFKVINDADGEFWQPNQYRTVVRRIEDGYRRCNELSNFFLERAECEKAFARQLRNWSRRWSDHLEHEGTSTYETANHAWSAFIVESNLIADMHVEIADNLKMVVNRLKAWQRDNYIKGMIHNKTVKEFDDDFKKAQKPWIKAQSRLQKAKREFHSTSRLLSAAETIKTSADCDLSLTAENKKKAVERYERARREKASSEQRYKTCISENVDILPTYREQMLQVFNRSRAFERERLIFFKDILQSAHQCIDTSNRGQIRSIYSDLANSIDAMDPSSDIVKWARECGADKQISLPEFEEYPGSDMVNPTPIITANTKRSTIKSSSSFRDSTRDIMQDSVYYHSKCGDSTDQSMRANHFAEPTDVSRPIGFVNQTLCGDNVGSAISSTDQNHPIFAMQEGSEYPELCNPFSPPPMPDRNATGPTADKPLAVPVRALYTYVPQEPDELALEEGMVFVMVTGEDEQGWSKGRNGSKEGLYPAAYAEPIQTDTEATSQM